jgi:alpha-1,6-mannosyltransferase
MGVCVDEFNPNYRDEIVRHALLAELPQRPAAPERTRLLLYSGRLSPEKNLMLLLETMERLAGDPAGDYRMLVAGSGPFQQRLVAMADRLVPGRLHFLGHISRRERLAELYANCDALVHPNPREPFGIAPLEAMASGLPVVVPRMGGVLSYATDDNSWLAAPTSEAFAAAVRSVFADENERKRRIENALWTARKFSWPNVTARFFDMYDDLYSRGQQRDARTDRATPVAVGVCPT